jgi:hypothetical protein
MNDFKTHHAALLQRLVARRLVTKREARRMAAKAKNAPVRADTIKGRKL